MPPTLAAAYDSAPGSQRGSASYQTTVAASSSSAQFTTVSFTGTLQTGDQFATVALVREDRAAPAHPAAQFRFALDRGEAALAHRLVGRLLAEEVVQRGQQHRDDLRDGAHAGGADLAAEPFAVVQRQHDEAELVAVLEPAAAAEVR